MASRKTLRNLTSLFAASALLTCSLLMSRSAAAQKADPAPVATPPYKIAVFAGAQMPTRSLIRSFSGRTAFSLGSVTEWPKTARTAGSARSCNTL